MVLVREFAVRIQTNSNGPTYHFEIYVFEIYRRWMKDNKKGKEEHCTEWLETSNKARVTEKIKVRHRPKHAFVYTNVFPGCWLDKPLATSSSPHCHCALYYGTNFEDFIIRRRIHHESLVPIINAKSTVKIDPSPLAVYFIAPDVDDDGVALALFDRDCDWDFPELGLVADAWLHSWIHHTSTGVRVIVPVCVVRTVVTFAPFARSSSSVHTPAEAESKPHSTWNSAETEPVAWAATSNIWEASSMSVTGERVYYRILSETF